MHTANTWCTVTPNMKQKPKLTKTKVAQIRTLHASGSGLGSLAVTFGVSRTHIKRIVRGEVWK